MPRWGTAPTGTAAERPSVGQVGRAAEVGQTGACGNGRRQDPARVGSDHDPAEQTLAAIVDTFLPAAEGLPSASELGVHSRLLEEVDALGKPAIRRQLDLLVWAMATPSGRWPWAADPGGPTSLADMDQAGRQAFMRRLAASPIPLNRTAFQDLKRLTLLLAYGIEDSPWRTRTGFVPQVPDQPSVPYPCPHTGTGEMLEADVVVIGSGAGGAVTAAVLAAAGRRVVVLEQAAMVGEERFGGPELDGLGALFLDRGLAATSDRWISIRAGGAVGGGTVINWASSLRAPAAVREEWRAAGMGDDLDEHYDAIEAASVSPDESARNGPNGRLAAGLDALGIPWRSSPAASAGAATAGRARWAAGAGRTVRPAAVARGGVRGGRRGPRPDGGPSASCATAIAQWASSRACPAAGSRSAPRRSPSPGEPSSRPAVLLRSGIARDRRPEPAPAPGRRVAGIYGEPRALVRRAADRDDDHFGEIDGPWGFRMEAAPTHPGLIASGFPWWGSAGTAS